MKHKNTTLKQAKLLRKNMTKQESKLWYVLRNNNFLGYKFKRQVPIGNYVADFVCELKNLIIEIDGGQHNEFSSIEYDKKRTDFLESKGYTVLRFWNNEIESNFYNVCESIRSFLLKL